MAAQRKPGPPPRWTPDGHDRIAAGLTNVGHPPLVAELAAEFAVLSRPGDDPPTIETWIAASQTARACAAAVRPAFDTLTSVADDESVYEVIAGVLATWDGRLDPTLTSAAMAAMPEP